MFLTAEFLKPEPVASGVSALLSAGFGRDQIEIYSDKPVELPKGLLDRPGRTSLLAVLGAIVSGGLATAFVFYTQHDYPLLTGGMPLVSGWATGVISWELTMAGAVAGIVLAFVWQAGLLRRRKGGPPPPLKEGSVYLQVRCTEHSATTAAECLSRAGAVKVVTQEGQ